MININGFVLVDAPHSALNNAGMDAGSKTDNTVIIKSIRRGRDVFPYISAQAWRYWWRETLSSKKGWKMSPISRESKIAFTAANPFTYNDDDVFGYMRAQSKKEGGTLTRISPLKTSPLVSIYSQQPTNDFGVMARHDGDPVPFEHQFYSLILKGIFSLDLTNSGVFGLSNKTGFKNLDEKYVETPEIKKSIEEKSAIFDESKKCYILPKDERVKRATDTIESLNYIYGGAKQTLHHTDVTPKLIILAVIEGGNNLFMNILNEGIADNYKEKVININALDCVIRDYDSIIKSDIFIGRNEGFLDNLKEDFETLASKNNKVKLNTVKNSVDSFCKIIESYIE